MFLLGGIMLASQQFKSSSSSSQKLADPYQEAWAPMQTLASANADDKPFWQELEPPRMWSMSLGYDGNQTSFYEHAVHFQSLKYGGPSATLNEVKVVEVQNSGCDPLDYEAAASRIAIVQESSRDCELWVAASNAANAGALAVLFYNASAYDALLFNSLLPGDWKRGDPLISIPVLSVTQSLGLALLGNQSSILLSIVTRNVLAETEESTRDKTFIERMIERMIASLRYIVHTISSAGDYVLDRFTAAVNWLWEYSKGVTLFLGAALAPVALNTASSVATKTIEFGARGMYAATAAAMGILYRILRLSRRAKGMVPTSENQASAEVTVETIQPRGVPAAESAPMDVKRDTHEITSTHPIFSIYFVGASFIAGLVLGGCFAVAVVAATRPTPI
ncbi:unnamed protein product [Mortierella alpina]